jgi:hypothetical protein
VDVEDSQMGAKRARMEELEEKIGESCDAGGV